MDFWMEDTSGQRNIPDDSEELLVSDEHEEDVNGEFWESDEEEF